LAQWAFVFEQSIEGVTELQLNIRYSGLIHNDLTGLYRNTHTDADGRTASVVILNKLKQFRVSAVTQFEPTLARKMFPCWDEPAFKAVFEVSVVRDRNHISRSNMHLLNSENISSG
jgi:aminopeptidase N